MGLLSVLSHDCRPIDSSHAISLGLTSPADGLLRIEVQERGISTVSFLKDDEATASASPVARLGTVVLTANVRRGQATEVEVHARDSQDIRGEACVSAQLVAPADLARQQAELAFAAAGRATRATDWSSAFDHYLSAARRFDHLRLQSAAAMARSAMAQLAYWRFDRKRDAYALASMALADYGTSADPLLLGALAELEAEALLDMPGVDPAGVAPDARRWLETARRYESTNRYGARELPRVEILMGYLRYLLNEVEPARATFKGAAQSCHDLGDWDCYAVASQNLAFMSEDSKDYSFALSAYADALRQLPPELDPKLTADIWNNMGRLQGMVGLFSASERSHSAAMQAYAKLGDCQGVRRSLVRAGNLLVHVGNLADAESDLARAASFDCRSLLASAATPTGQGPADPVLLSASARRDAHEMASAAPAQPCARPLDPAPLTRETKTIVFSSVLSLSLAAMLTGDSREVWRCLDAASLYEPNARNQVRLANALGSAYLELGDPKRAQAAFTRALRIADAAGLPMAYEYRRSAQLGLVKAMLVAGKAAQSLASAYDALSVSTARSDIENTITALRLIAAGYDGSGQQGRAVRVLQVAADLIEAVPIDQLDGEQRATFLASQHTVFAQLTDILAAEKAADDSAAWHAFEASERGRSRSLRYALTQQTRDASSPVGAPPTAKYRSMLAEVAGLTATSRGHDALLEEIDKLARQDRTGAAAIDRPQLQRTLGQLDATLVEYASGSSEMIAFIIDGEHARAVHLGDRQEIARLTAELRDALRDPETPASQVRAAAVAVARLVWWPITQYLPGGRIVIVPDDALNTVPLTVLPWAEHSAQLVLERAETTIIPSALFLMRVHRTASAHSEAPRIGLIGDPVFRVSDWRRECTGAPQPEPNSTPQPTRALERTLTSWTESLPRLPGTRLEIASIARLARESRPASRIETLVGCAAVPSALRKLGAADLDLLHIATHARIDAQRPRLSALALTPESPSDGTASTFGLLDILGLKLNSKLVVLSACDTSRGRLLPGEGVLGPAQAFLQAGSAAVLASYWKVDDQITSTFMQRFYKYLLVDRLSASAALRRTQLESAASGKTYEWAAFSLYGWPDSSI
jgi:CHAT domain-containing protein/tetratricopeptide (TPR) repeat protein